ncbi:MAG: NAD(P)H-dependent oxidoreductase [Syntrophomonas sp.]|nr:NAD(P)H-dependent oxidoreductase [Syntrophomonas sp.]
MRILVLNGSPRKNGTVANLLKSVVDGISNRYEVEWINVYELNIKPCIGCMKCRTDQECHSILSQPKAEEQ